MTWRDHLLIHPAASLFPLMSRDELRQLADDVKQHGLRQPCRFIEDEDGRSVLVDGRNRLDALQLLGEEITLDNSVIFEQLSSDVVDPYAYVISANIHRRHLTAEQRQELLIKLIARDPERSDRQIAKETGYDHKTIGAARSKGEDVGKIPHVSKRLDSTGRKQPLRAKAKPNSVMLAEAVIGRSAKALADFKFAADAYLPRMNSDDLKAAHRHFNAVWGRERGRIDGAQTSQQLRFQT